MSGELVVAPVALPIGLLAAGVAAVGIAGVAAGSIAAKAIKSLVDSRVEAARRRVAEEEASIAEWQHHQSQQQLRMEALKRIQDSILDAERRLAAIPLYERRVNQAGGGPQARGYLLPRSTDADRAELHQQFTELSALIDSLPSDFREADGSAYRLLAEYTNRLQTRFDCAMPPSLEEIISLREAVERTLAAFRAETERNSLYQEAIGRRVAALLTDVGTWRHLASGTQDFTELEMIRGQLLAALQAGHIEPGFLELLEKALVSIRTSINASVLRSALRSTLADSIVAHLEELRYELIEPFAIGTEESALHARMKVPGGEYLDIVLHDNNEISFRLVHEHPFSLNQESRLAEVALFREQEKLWCRDCKDLVRHLVADGFSYQIDFEREVPLDSIQAVVLETAEEILADNQELPQLNSSVQARKRRRKKQARRNRE